MDGLLVRLVLANFYILNNIRDGTKKVKTHNDWLSKERPFALDKDACVIEVIGRHFSRILCVQDDVGLRGENIGTFLENYAAMLEKNYTSTFDVSGSGAFLNGESFVKMMQDKKPKHTSQHDSHTAGRLLSRFMGYNVKRATAGETVVNSLQYYYSTFGAIVSNLDLTTSREHPRVSQHSLLPVLEAEWTNATATVGAEQSLHNEAQFGPACAPVTGGNYLHNDEDADARNVIATWDQMTHETGDSDCESLLDSSNSSEPLPLAMDGGDSITDALEGGVDQAIYDTLCNDSSDDATALKNTIAEIQKTHALLLEKQQQTEKMQKKAEERVRLQETAHRTADELRGRESVAFAEEKQNFTNELKRKLIKCSDVCIKLAACCDTEQYGTPSSPNQRESYRKREAIQNQLHEELSHHITGMLSCVSNASNASNSN